MEAISEFDSFDAWKTAEFSQPSTSLIKQLEYIPIVSSIVGIARVAFGLLQTLFGIVALPFQLCRDAYKGKSHPFILLNGLSNIVRGVIAFKPIIGNIILYVYDKMMEKKVHHIQICPPEPKKV